MSNTKNIRIAKLRKRLFKKNIKRSKVMNIVVCIIFALYTLTLLYPLFWALLASLKTNEEFMLANRNGFPIDWTFANYVTAYESMSVTGVSMIAMLFNSFWYSGVGAFLNVFVCATSAYVLSRYKFIGQKFIYGLAMLVMVLPIVGALPSEYRVYHILGIADSPLILLTQVGGFGFNFIVLYGIFKGIAKDYMEAAFVDGAGHFTVFFRIMLPQVTGTMLALFLVMFIGRWNDYNICCIYRRKKNLQKRYKPSVKRLKTQTNKITHDGGKERQFASGLARMPFPVVVLVCGVVSKSVKGFSRVLVCAAKRRTCIIQAHAKIPQG